MPMKQHDPRKPLFSIHIPKCAGSSFSEVLKGWFGSGYRRHYPNEKRNTPPRKHNLYTGITERLQESVDRLAQTLGFPSRTVPEKNVSD